MKKQFRRLLAQEDLNFLLTNRVPRIALTHFMGKFRSEERRVGKEC